MTATSAQVKPFTTAPLKNVALMMGLVTRLREAKPHLPRIGCMYGFSGYGKSIATTYAANKLRNDSVYVEARSKWTSKKFLEALLQELNVPPGAKSKPVYEMIDIAAERLMVGRKVLFVDEADHVYDRGYIEILRDLYQIANCPIVLIGEERLPDKLRRYERLHNRILELVPAQACDIEDASHLAKMVCEVTVKDDLLERLIAEVGGCTRRVVANLDDIEEEALKMGWASVDLKAWGDRGFKTGDAVIRTRGGR